MTKPKKWSVRTVWSVFTVRSLGSWGPNISSCGQQRLWLDWASAQADLSLWWVQTSFCWICREVALHFCHSVFICWHFEKQDLFLHTKKWAWGLKNRNTKENTAFTCIYFLPRCFCLGIFFFEPRHEKTCFMTWPGVYHNSFLVWATTWQNQQNECAPSEDSDQPGRPPSLIRVFTVRMKKAWVLSYPFWSESSLGAHSLCWFCHVAAHLLFTRSMKENSTGRSKIRKSDTNLPNFFTKIFVFLQPTIFFSV